MAAEEESAMEVMVFRLWLAVIIVKHTCDLNKERECNILMLFFSCMAPAPLHLYVQQTISRNRFREITFSSDTSVPGKICGLSLPKSSALCKKSFQLTARLQGLSSTSARFESLGFVVWWMSVPQKGVWGFQISCGDITGASTTTASFTYPHWGEVQPGKMLAGQFFVEKSWIIHGVRVFSCIFCGHWFGSWWLFCSSSGNLFPGECILSSRSTEMFWEEFQHAWVHLKQCFFRGNPKLWLVRIENLQRYSGD